MLQGLRLLKEGYNNHLQASVADPQYLIGTEPAARFIHTIHSTTSETCRDAVVVTYPGMDDPIRIPTSERISLLTILELLTIELGKIMPITQLLDKDGNKQNSRLLIREVNVFLECNDRTGALRHFFTVQVCNKAVMKDGSVVESRLPGLDVGIEITI